MARTAIGFESHPTRDPPSNGTAKRFTAENGPVRIEIETLEDAVAYNRTLPCGAEVISAQTVGEFTSATFRLSERPGGGCGSGVGGRPPHRS